MSGSTSKLRILLYSFLSSCSVVFLSLLLQWLIYADWLHDPGPVRLVGTVLASVLTFLLVWLWQERIRREQVETLRRLEVIAKMNDRIRNALQAIDCIAYLKDEAATQTVRQAVDVIDSALRGVSTEIVDARPLLKSHALTAPTHR
ncbi:MAG TPA: hypothetical protein VMU28_14975 [Terriglobales bacterium]|nr:hypothetical protein [Terriglobales bacterium]